MSALHPRLRPTVAARIGHRRRCGDGAASRRHERAFLRDLPNLARAASTYSYSPDGKRGLISTIALPDTRAGTPRREGSPAAQGFTAGPPGGGRPRVRIHLPPAGSLLRTPIEPGATRVSREPDIPRLRSHHTFRFCRPTRRLVAIIKRHSASRNRWLESTSLQRRVNDKLANADQAPPSSYIGGDCVASAGLQCKTAIAPTPKRRCGGPVANVRLAARSKAKDDRETMRGK